MRLVYNTVIISCTILTHSGKFGVVYRATLSRWKEYEQEIIAVKTLKGSGRLWILYLMEPWAAIASYLMYM